MGNIRKIKITEWAQSTIIFILGIASFIFILVNRQPIPLRPIALQVRYGFTLFAPISFVILWMVLSIKGFFGKLMSFVAVLCLFALGLSGLWAGGLTERQVIGGLLPTTDAGEYYHNALRLLNGSNFFDFASRRPIFPSFLTTLLWISNKNLQICIALMVLIVAICTYLTIIGLRRYFNSFVITSFLIFAYLFYRRYSGIVMSENLGFSLGLLSFYLLMNGLFEQKIHFTFLSLFLISYALNVRAGAFLILPFLIFGLLKNYGGINTFKKLFTLIAITALGFLISYLFFKVLGAETGEPFSNFAHTFYGLAQGGKGWSQIYTDHPEIMGLGDAELSQKIYEYTFETIRTNPWNMIVGIIKQYKDFFYFVNSNLSVFSFISGGNVIVYNLTQITLYILSLFGLYHIFLHRQEPFYQVLLLILLGIILSAPFITSDASEMRAYATTIAFILVLPVIGISETTKKLFEFSNPFKDDSSKSLHITIGIVLSALIFFSFAAILIRFLTHPEKTTKMNCPNGQSQITVDIRPGTYLKIHPESIIFLDWVPDLHEIEFKSLYISYSLDINRDEIRQLPSPSEIVSTINLDDNRDMFLVIDNQSMFDKFGVYSICGYWSNTPPLPNISQYFYSKVFQNPHNH